MSSIPTPRLPSPISSSSLGLASLKGVEGHDEDDILQGQGEVWELMYAFVDPLEIKCAIELRIPDIIHSHGSPMSLSQIASQIGSPSPCIESLSRIMRLLVRKKIFSNVTPSDGSEETLYGLTNVSRWLLQDGSEKTLAPKFMMETHPWMMSPFHQLSATIKEGGITFEKAHGCSIWERARSNPKFNSLLNNGMASTAKVIVEAILSVYKDGFQGVETLVDVAGGKGDLLAEIVKANSPQIKGINFDLKHVVESAPAYPRVTHIGGDMFECVPCADAIIMKWVLHDWSDEDCVKILLNCKKAMSKTKKGKLILVESVLQPNGDGLFDETAMRLDLVMIGLARVGRRELNLNGLTCSERLVFQVANSSKFQLSHPLSKPMHLESTYRMHTCSPINTYLIRFLSSRRSNGMLDK